MEIMPQNKRESLIYTIMMCFVMVLWMSMYNVAPAIRHGKSGSGGRRLDGLPLRLSVRHMRDWFIASRIAKGVAFRYLVKPPGRRFEKKIPASPAAWWCAW